MNFTMLALVAASVLCGFAPARAQVQAQQGPVAGNAEKRFTSPMLLKISLADLLGQSEVHGFSVAGVREFHCEDASIPAMSVDVSTSRKGARTYAFSGMLLVDESFDRFVTVDLVLLADEVKVGHGRQMNISVEERKSNRFAIRFDLDPGAVAKVDAASDLSLQLTMHVRKD